MINVVILEDACRLVCQLRAGRLKILRFPLSEGRTASGDQKERRGQRYGSKSTQEIAKLLGRGGNKCSSNLFLSYGLITRRLYPVPGVWGFQEAVTALLFHLARSGESGKGGTSKGKGHA